MTGVWRKTLTYLGLVEDDELDEQAQQHPVAGQPMEEEHLAPRGLRRFQRGREPEPAVIHGPATSTATEPHEAIVRTIPQSRPHGSSMIHRAEPKRFNEARELGEKFKDGIAVIMNLQETDDQIARRLVDFASGLVFGLEGKIELVANRVYLLTPQDVDVSAEERERIRDSGFYNQF